MDIDLNAVKQQKSTEELLRFGILNVDKPSGPTSFKVADTVRRLLGARKTGHFGTLDPLATGVLPVALNRAVRLAQWFMHRDKTYHAVMHLHRDVPQDELREHMNRFLGEITQLPPVRSRVKRQHRQRHVGAFEVMQREGRDVHCLVECEAGTYVRKLIHDMGLGIGGAHMTGLSRTRASVFSSDDPTFAALPELEEAVGAYRRGDDALLRSLLVPGEIVSEVLPVLGVREEAADPLLNGQAFQPEHVEGEPDMQEGQDYAVFCGTRFIEVVCIVAEEGRLGKPRFVLTPDGGDKDA